MTICLCKKVNLIENILKLVSIPTSIIDQSHHSKPTAPLLPANCDVLGMSRETDHLTQMLSANILIDILLVSSIMITVLCVTQKPFLNKGGGETPLNIFRFFI